MKRLFGICMVVGLVAVGAAAWAQDGSSPAHVAVAAQVDDPVTPVTVPAPEVAPVDTPVDVAAPAPASAPVEVERPIVWPVPEAPPLPPFSSDCEIVHSGARWGVYGVTNLPRGTVFTMTVSDDDETATVDLPARAGGIVMKGVRYGPVDGYTDDGTTIFGPTSADMIRLATVDDHAHATVTVGGLVVCTA